MKLRNFAAIGIVSVWLTAFPALAQISTFRANIPFPFVVGDQTLPAATYVVQRVLGKPNTANDIGVIVMKASSHHVYKVIVTDEVGAEHHFGRQEKSSLVFTTFKGKQYLNRIWVEGDIIAHQVATAPAEIAFPNATNEITVTALNYSKAK